MNDSELPRTGRHLSASGTFIALEGGDGSGKSTQIHQLVEWLTEQGHQVVQTREPGGSAVGQRLRAVVLDPDSVIDARTEALIFAADRAQHVAEIIAPALANGQVVVTDRYMDSSIAYQGAGRVLTDTDIEAFSMWATQGLVPHLTILLDLAPEIGAKRRGQDSQRSGDDRMEANSEEFHRRVRDGFLARAAVDPERYLVLDASEDPETIAEHIRAAVSGLL